MAPKIKAVPEGLHTATVLLTVRHALEAIAFYKKAFGAIDFGEPFLMPDGSVAHAELKIGDSRLMLCEEGKEVPTKSPQSLSATTAAIHLYVEDVDALFTRAVEAGAKVVFPLANQFYGDRAGRVIDPFGHQWILATHVEDVSMDEMKKRLANLKP